MADRSPIPFDDIPLLDNHAHPMLPAEAAAREPFARYFTEADAPAIIARHARHTLFFRWAVRELAGFLDRDASEDAVVAARAARPLSAYLRALLTDAHVETVLLDDGYPRTGALSVEETARMGGVRARRVLRIERVVEDLIPACESLADLEAALVRELETAAPDLAALKSIIAYRTGLAVSVPDPGIVAEALRQVREAWGGTPGRLASKPLNDHVLLVAAEWAAARGMPLHFHTGYGDRDVVLQLTNPVHLRPLLEEGVLTFGPVVFLHASYPYTREAAYLASVYPNVYVDISEAAPMLAGPELARVLEGLLALAPITKVLYGSDAWAVPEWFWLGARAARRALAEALAALSADEQAWAARRILHDNAAELHGLV
jgi:hypothetical protein